MTEPFLSDAPKQDPWTEDRLGYRAFAERLAHAIRGIKAPDGYVIGLHGAWGSGKSTALNFTKHFIGSISDDEDQADRVQVVEFQPWIVSGHQDLVSSFFKVLSEHLSDKTAKRDRFKKRVGGALKAGGDPIIDAAATLGLVADPSAGLLAKTGSAIAKKSLSTAVDQWLKEPSLQAAYESLRKRLLEQNTRFLVVIDDIDRLTGDEIRTMMQLVKTVGRLPNVIYLLAYDRGIVDTALVRTSGDAPDAPRFIEKIVQHEISLPRVSRGALLRMLDEKLVFLTGPTPDSTRWMYIVQAGVHRWVKNPRDVSRLVNAVQFAWPALKGEFDPQDLLAMEGLRLFDSPTFEWLKRNRDLIFAQGRYQYAGKEAREAEAGRLKAEMLDGAREPVVELLSALFPTLAKALADDKRISFGEEAYYQVRARRGVGSEQGYDAYFSLSPSEHGVLKADVDAAIAGLEDEALQSSLLSKYLSKKDEQGLPLIGEYLEDIGHRFIGANAVLPSVALLHALFATGEEIQGTDWNRDFGIFSPRGRLHSLIVALLDRWGPDEAGRSLQTAFDRSQSPSVCAEVFVSRARELKLLPSEGTSPAQRITGAALALLGERLLHLIEEGAADGTLENAPFYFDIARAWAYLRDVKEPRRWLAEGARRSATFLAKVSFGLLAYSVSTTQRHYFLRDVPDADLYDLPALFEACQKRWVFEDLSTDYTERLRALCRDLGKRLSKADDAVEDQEFGAEH